MSILIRDVREHELDSVLALNNAAGPGILPMDASRIRFFFDNADYFRVGEIDGHLAGFLIALSHTAAHDSPNFLWFRDRFDAFMYIDRIVIASARRGAGLGRAFYADITSYSEVRVPQLCCEVFLEPRNDVALLFHGTYGFHEAGQQVMAGVDRRVSLQAKELPSHAWVHETYLSGGRSLPNLPWLSSRTLRDDDQRLATGT